MAEKKKKAIVKKSRTAVKKKAVSRSLDTKKIAVKKKGSTKTVSKAVAAKKRTVLPARNAAKKQAIKKPATKKATAKKTVKPMRFSGKKLSVKKPPYKKPKKDEECFLTTACINYYGLADDAYELNTLRSFRDTYMATKEKGKELIKQYYSITPTLITLINKDKEHKTVYQSVFTVIQKACAEIEKKRFAKAQSIYVSLVRDLEKRYRVS